MTLAIVQDPQENDLVDPRTGTTIQTYFRKVTPALANKLLDNNFKDNRKIKNRAVLNYARQMKEGLWHPSASTIMLSASGRLIDGQHRLSAVVQSRCTVTMLFIANVPDEAVTAIDDGVKRSFADALTIGGKKMTNISTVSNTIKTLFKMHYSVSHNFNFESCHAPLGILSSSEMLEFHKKLPNYNQICDKFFTFFKYTDLGHNMSLSAALPIYYLFHDIEEEVTFCIFQSLESGIPFDGKGTKSPMYHFINRVRRKKEVGVRIRPAEFMCMFFWAWIKTKEGVDVKGLPKSFDWILNDAPELKEVRHKLMRIA